MKDVIWFCCDLVATTTRAYCTQPTGQEGKVKIGESGCIPGCDEAESKVVDSLQFQFQKCGLIAVFWVFFFLLNV